LLQELEHFVEPSLRIGDPPGLNELAGRLYPRLEPLEISSGRYPLGGQLLYLSELLLNATLPSLRALGALGAVPTIPVAGAGRRAAEADGKYEE
jgi:hypothetical protein